MIQFDVDWLDIVLDPSVVLGQDSSCSCQEDSNEGDEPEGAVPGSEVLLASDLLVEIYRAEPARRGEHCEQVEDPGDQDQTVQKTIPVKSEVLTSEAGPCRIFESCEVVKTLGKILRWLETSAGRRPWSSVSGARRTGRSRGRRCRG